MHQKRVQIDILPIFCHCTTLDAPCYANLQPTVPTLLPYWLQCISQTSLWRFCNDFVHDAFHSAGTYQTPTQQSVCQSCAAATETPLSFPTKVKQSHGLTKLSCAHVPVSDTGPTCPQAISLLLVLQQLDSVASNGSVSSQLKQSSQTDLPASHWPVAVAVGLLALKLGGHRLVALAEKSQQCHFHLQKGAAMSALSMHLYYMHPVDMVKADVYFSMARSMHAAWQYI